MTYTAVPQQSPYDQWTAADQNTYVRDNFADHQARISAIETVGNDADKPASPAVGDWYLATDTGTFYRCVSAGSWLKIWTADNDGAGSGLDADKLDGMQSDTSGTASTIAARDSDGNLTTAAGTVLASKQSQTRIEYANVSASSNGLTQTISGSWPNAFSSIASAVMSIGMAATAGHSITDFYDESYSATGFSKTIKTYGSGDTLSLKAIGIGT